MTDTNAKPERSLPPVFRWVIARIEEGASYLPHAAIVLAACLAVWALKDAGLLVGDAPKLHVPLLAGLVLILLPVRSASVAAPLLIVYRTIVALFAVFALVSYPTLSDGQIAESWFTARLVTEGRWLAVICGVAAWWRPALGLVPVVLAAWKKTHLEELYGFRLNATDYYIVAELCLFIATAIGIVALVEALLRRTPRAHLLPATRWSFGEAAFFAALALHLANYFYSAVAKIMLPGAGPLTWVLENDTHNIMMATALIGLGPLQGYPWLASAGNMAMGLGAPVFNTVTILAQLSAILCLLRLRWAIWLTVIYDLIHFGIFLSTGILFWKWMTLNAGLVVALGRLAPQRAAPWPVTLIGIGVMVLSPLIFQIAKLGWFDAAALNKPVIEAVLEDGSTRRVPSNFFLEGSAQIAKSEIGDPFEGHLQRIGAFGKAWRGADQMRASKTCDLPVADESGIAQSFARNPALERFFREHHAYVLAHADADGHFPYMWFPHHSWSNPRLFRAFAETDLRQIVKYRYIIESVCFRHDGRGGIDETLLLRGVHDIDIRN